MRVKKITDPAQFHREDVQVLSSETVFQGFMRLLRVRLKHRLFAGGWSAEVERELLQKQEGAAAIVYDPTHDLIGFVEQFRIGVFTGEDGAIAQSPWCLECVAGMVEAGEDPQSLILRELYEEAGISGADLRFITSYYSTPGGCNEKIHLFCALCDLSQAGGLYGLENEGEDILFATYAADDVFEAMLNNESRLNNAATLLGLQWLQRYRPGLRQGQ